MGAVGGGWPCSSGFYSWECILSLLWFLCIEDWERRVANGRNYLLKFCRMLKVSLANLEKEAANNAKCQTPYYD